jgi:hypothetical protein
MGCDSGLAPKDKSAPNITVLKGYVKVYRIFCFFHRLLDDVNDFAPLVLVFPSK